jgi:hypothetical protein
MKKNFGLLVLMSSLITCCATVPHKDITQVPHIEPSHVTIPALMFLKTRTLALQVTDQRSPDLRQNSEATTEELKTALTHILEASGIDIMMQAPTKLSVTFREGTNENKGPYCVQLSAHLQRVNRSYIDATASTCYEKNGPMNLKKGGDISYAYEQAIRLLFEKINEVGQNANAAISTSSYRIEKSCPLDGEPSGRSDSKRVWHTVLSASGIDSADDGISTRTVDRSCYSAT